jgi:hypothetical protein
MAVDAILSKVLVVLEGWVDLFVRCRAKVEVTSTCPLSLDQHSVSVNITCTERTTSDAQEKKELFLLACARGLLPDVRATPATVPTLLSPMPSTRLALDDSDWNMIYPNQ